MPDFPMTEPIASRSHFNVVHDQERVRQVSEECFGIFVNDDSITNVRDKGFREPCYAPKTVTLRCSEREDMRKHQKAFGKS